MSKTAKPASSLQEGQVLRRAFNSDDSSLTTAGFLVGKVGRKIERSISTTNVADDTETLIFSEDGQELYTIEIIYTDATLVNMISSERIS